MEPGEGAVEYAKSLTEGLTRKEAASIIHTVMIGPFEDPRVKWCVVCGYPFRDVTRPGNAKVCGPTCKTMQKTAQRRKQRQVKPRRNITIKAAKPVRYLWWLEYPYWTSESWMLSHVGSYERPHDPDKLLTIAAAKQRYEMMGGRRKPVRKAEY
ncbi:hypothetical protein [Paenibacillus polymyxa]|uniref:hypothetical protein n=1 Tax=Paenibacillus polymyxa TaxID=1406 RepID=UPI0009C01EE0|nr:hypothetical protein [Paenibacillus polymyxa]